VAWGRAVLGAMRKFLGGAYTERLQAVAPRWLIEVAVALICVALSGLFRVLVDLVAPGALAFGLVYPIVLLATLIAGWRSGALTLLIAGVGAWYFVMPPRMSFRVADFTTGVNIIAFFVTGGVVVILAAFVMAELRARIAEYEVMRREVDHRVKNNFQMILGLLEMQANRATDPELKDALSGAATRISGFARAHRRLYGAEVGFQTVNFAGYLRELCTDLDDAAPFGRTVAFDCDMADFPLSHDRAVAAGSIVNELVTNALKHAFEPGDPGQVQVVLVATGSGRCDLTVRDDGRGLPADYQSGKGLGHRILGALVKQSEGELRVGEGPGASFTLSL
jgi:two-component sensor histidine kinase